ncbi:MAG: PAS domain-containing protein [Halolamina sp.]
MSPGRDRELLVETLGDRYRIETTTDVATLETEFDCCVLDAHEFNRVAGTIQSRRDTATPGFLPFVLLVASDSAGTTNPEVWEYTDDVIELPVKKAELLARIGNLVERRRTAVELEKREQQLEQTVEDLRLKERAMDEAPIGITITEAGGEDNPLIYVNEQFKRLTGYESNLLGEDCRFLQGPETDPDAVTTIREAINANEPVSVDILNYRKNGQRFWNKLDIAPLHDEHGEVTQYVGFQTDITDRKIKERRLQVLNRVLNHNLRNRMNVVEGYLTLLRDEYDGEPPDAVAQIETAAADLMGLADAVQKVERTLDGSESAPPVIRLDRRLEQLVSAFQDRFPDATFDLTTPEAESCEVAVVGLVTAIEEAIENAVVHNDSETPVVDITADRRSENWVDIEITDNGPGIPPEELDVLRKGETPLRHANRLGIWLMYWVVSRAGGEFSVSEADTEGTTVRFSVPTYNE